MKLTWFNSTNRLWSNQTCDFRDEGDFWVSECDHLTDFTLIVDGMQKDPSLCSTALTVIGYIINMGSILSLITLNLIFLMHRISLFKGSKLARLLYARTTVDTFTLFYNTILLTFYVSFGIFSDEKHTSGSTGCKVVAGINYWLLLCCICMSIFQAWRIVKVFSWTTAGEKIMTWLTHKIVIIGVTLGFPTLMALILGLAFKDFYNRDDEFCWIRPDYIVPGVVIPLTLLVANGIFCLVIISFRLFPKLCGLAKKN
uniref:G-protein coupled receptors family 2 profile 2 domain-containing protein n=1 Tax=Acrobeloides nanus TaxID=290746 RepID=A0A914D318_9BILA